MLEERKPIEDLLLPLNALYVLHIIISAFRIFYICILCAFLYLLIFNKFINIYSAIISKKCQRKIESVFYLKKSFDDRDSKESDN